jgi:hypothetical protein
MSIHLREGWGTLLAGTLAVGLGGIASGQNATTAPPEATPRTEARETIRDARESAQDARKDKADTARDARQGARATAQDARQDGRETAKNTTRSDEETKRDARQDGRETAKDARRDGFDSAKGARRDARDAVGNAREAVRDARRDARAENLRNLRSADLGLWFDSKASVKGLVISDIAAEGAIAKAGFKEGDRIVSINSQPVATQEEFMRLLLAENLRDQQTTIVVMRDGREASIKVNAALLVHEMAVHDPLWRSGIVLDDRDPNRVVVLRVYPRTPAYYAGLRAGDVITGVRGQRIARIADLVQGLVSGQGDVGLQVNRGNRPRDLQINIGEEGVDLRTVLKPDADREDRLSALPSEPRVEVPADQKPSLSPATNPAPKSSVAPQPNAVPQPTAPKTALPK